MKQSPFRETNSRSASQEIPHHLWIRRFIPVVTRSRQQSLSRTRWIQSILTAYYFQIYFNITLHSTPRSPKCQVFRPELIIHFNVKLQVLVAASMKITVFWDVGPCGLVEIDRRFRGDYCPNLYETTTLNIPEDGNFHSVYHSHACSVPLQSHLPQFDYLNIIC
jgi:hypothetical protein